MKTSSQLWQTMRTSMRGLLVVAAIVATVAMAPGRALADSTMTAHWAFDETSGSTAFDSSGNSQDGTNTDATISTDIPSTAFTNIRSLSFDGTSSVVSAPPQAALTGNHSRTISLWFKTTVDGVNQGVFDSGGIGHDTAMEIYTVTAGGASFAPPTNPGGIAIVMWDNDIYVPIGIDAVADGQWHLLTFTYDEATQQSTLYFDGTAPQAYLWDGNAWSLALESQPFTTVDPLNTSANDVQIGAARTGYFNMGNLFFTGNIDDVRIYDSALTAAGVSNLAGGSNDPSTPATNPADPTGPAAPVVPGAPDTGFPRQTGPDPGIVGLAVVVAVGLVGLFAAAKYLRPHR